MYRYDNYDQRLVAERVAQFRDQTRRFLAGELTEEEFRPLRLQNGLYMQRHAPMLRVAIPYGTAVGDADAHAGAHRAASTTAATATSRRARTSSSTGRSSRTCPKSCAELATVEMHAIQTSRQLHPQHHDRPVRRRRAPTRSSIRVRWPRSCASGRPSIRNSPACRASSRSR